MNSEANISPVQEVIAQAQARFQELIGFKNLEALLQTILSILLTHEEKLTQTQSAQVEAIEGQLCVLWKRVEDLEASLKVKDDEYKKLLEAFKAFEKRAEETNVRIARIEDDFSRYEEVNASKKAEVSQMFENMQGLRQQMDILDATSDRIIIQQKETRETLMGKVGLLETKITKLDDEMDSKLDVCVLEGKMKFGDADMLQMKESVYMIQQHMDAMKKDYTASLESLDIRLESKADRDSISSIEYLLKRYLNDEVSSAAGKIQYRCLTCNQSVPSIIDGIAARAEPNTWNTNQGYSSLNHSASQQTKQFSILGVDGKVYKGRDDSFIAQDEAPQQMKVLPQAVAHQSQRSVVTSPGNTTVSRTTSRPTSASSGRIRPSSANGTRRDSTS